ncbi:L-amino acid N-acyltransferase YncA [Streptosporangium album]|uniref:L-amino acid N-acyltransferase YncA n=1 Tax=Streptosporangium album TaxID=47479 RepID=A0A7W7S2Z0_9ACTN|nr:hypothetical protein [Streptosporangium album]MBB4942954.1 L-amino acid N-acyltransferase YncA [Streptosporangium album]
MSTQEAAVRAAAPEDLGRIAEIFSHYVIGGVTTFEEVPPTVAHRRQRFGDLAERRLPCAKRCSR